MKSPGFTKTGTTIAGIIYKARCPLSCLQSTPVASPASRDISVSMCSMLLTRLHGTAMQDGVVLGADTRSTAGTTVADKNCEKIHYIAPNIYCCGAGTAADTENVTGVCPRQMPDWRASCTSATAELLTQFFVLQA